MDRPDLYDRDILVWSEQQATALRRLASRHDLPNDLDLGNVVEEIESVGRTELRAAESFSELILIHVAKAVSDPDAATIAQWRTECIGWRAQLLRAFSPAMRQRIDMDGIWKSALEQAEAALAEHSEQLAASLSGPCLISLDDLLSQDCEFRDVVSRIAGSTS
jgi:Domain of unknown function DUF29